MSDPRFEALLTDYVEGTLSAAERAQVEAALAEDPALAAEVAQIERVRALTATLPEERPPADLSDAVFAATTRRRRLLLHRLFAPFPWARALAPLATTLLVLAAVGVAVFGYFGVTRQLEKTPLVLSQNKAQAPPAAAPAPAGAREMDKRVELPEAKNERQDLPKLETAALKAPAPDALRSKTAPAAGPAATGAGEGSGYGGVGLAGRGVLGAAARGGESGKKADQAEVADDLKRNALGRDDGRLKDRFAADESADEAADRDVGGAAQVAPAKPLAGAPAPAEEGELADLEQERQPKGKTAGAKESPAAAPPPAMRSESARAVGQTRARSEAIDATAVEEKKAEANVEIGQHWEGRLSGVNRAAVYIVTAPEKWRELWRLMHASLIEPPPAPEIDFAAHAVVGVFMGLKTTGGYDTRVVDVQPEDGALTVVVRETQPRHGQMVTMAMTQPYSVVVVPRVLDGLTLDETTPVRLRRR